MKSSLNQILYEQIVGKKLAKQKLVHENFWGASIIDVYASRDVHSEDHAIYVIRTNCQGNNLFVINIDDEIELE